MNLLAYIEIERGDETINATIHGEVEGSKREGWWIIANKATCACGTALTLSTAEMRCAERALEDAFDRAREDDAEARAEACASEWR